MTYEAYETSSAQKRLYLIDQLYGDGILYNMTFGWLIRGYIEPPRLENAVKKLIQRHETLRTSFAEKDGQVLQKVHEHLEFQLKFRQLEKNSTKLIHTVIDDFIQPFHLTDVPLWRMELIQLETGKQLLLWDIHHIISDGVSMDVAINDLMTFYTGKNLPELEYQYVDFTLWQNEQWQGDRIKRQEQYWLNVFAGELPVWEMPVDYPRSLTLDFNGNAIDFKMNRDLTSKIKKLALKHNTTLYVLLLTLYTILLSKTTGQEDIVVGTPITGRTHREFETIIGMFVNTLAIRNQPYGLKTFSGFLKEVSQHVFSAFENQDYPFEMLVEKLVPQRRLNQNPLFDTMFALQNYSQKMEILDPEQGKLKCVPYLLKEKTAKFELTLAAVEEDECILFSLLYRTALFRKDTMERFIRHFLKLTRDVVTNPTLKISNLEINTQEEIEFLLNILNAPNREYPKNTTIHELFEKQVKKTPDHIALVGQILNAPGETVSITSKELNKKANQLAHYLCSRGIKANDFAGLMAEKSLEMIIAILGILKAGFAYVPLNPRAPLLRTKYILEECGTGILLTNCWSSEMRELSKVSEPVDLSKSESLYSSVIPGHGTGSATTQPAAITINKVHSPGDLAYIIFTSGSTGKPKGVPITHANLCPLLHWGYKHLGLGPKDRTIQNLAYYFDWSVWEIFITLTTGACLYPASEDVLLNHEANIEFMDKHAITVLHITPTQYQYLAHVGWKTKTLKYLFIGAEKLTYDLVQQGLASVNRDCRVFNMYGPTEAAIISAVLEIYRSDYERFRDLSSVPIGIPVANTTILILDKYLKLCQVNMPGELYIGGDGLAAGYLCDAEKSLNSFITNVYESKGIKGRRLYKTNDLARWLPDGNIEFLGRKDHQVKIRGFRIELGEIESQLLKHPGVKKAVVLQKADKTGDKYLCAYIVSNGELIPAELKKYLSAAVPDYMIPSYFIPMEKIPLTGSGKIDRKALPEPEVKPAGIKIPPGNSVEKKLTEIWSEILNLDLDTSIGIDDNFFESGGHSLKANTLMSKIHKEFKIKIPLEQIFKTPIIRELAEYIKNANKTIYASITPVEKKSYYPVSSAQKRMFILNRLKGNETSDNTPLVVRAAGKLDKNRFEKAITKLIKRHEVFRTSFQLIDEKFPIQIVHPEVDFQTLFAEIHPDEIDRAIAGAVRPFDLSKAPLLRAALFRLSTQEHIIMCDMHHIISDGTARIIFINEFINLYEYETEGEELPELQIQYKDFTCWQNQLLESNYIKKQEEYWCTIFGDASIAPLLNMPTDFPRPKIQSFAGCSINFQLSKNVTVKVRSFILERNVTLYMFLMAAYNILLSRWGGQEDIVVGTPIAGRPHADLGQIIGMFVNTLPMRNYPSGEKTFGKFLEEVKANALNAYENQDYQFEELVNRLGIKPDPGRHPLFDTMFVVQNIDVNTRGLKKEIKDISFSPYQFEENITQFDIITHAFEGEADGVIDFKLRYCVKLFKQETIERFINFFKEIITVVVDNPNIKLKEIKLSHGLFDQKLNAFEQEGDFDF